MVGCVEVNVTNISDIASVAYTTAEEVVILTLWSVITLPTIFLNILMIVTVITVKQFHTVGYALIVAMSVSEVLALTFRVLLPVPTTVWYKLYVTAPHQCGNLTAATQMLDGSDNTSLCTYLWYLGFLVAFARRTLTPNMILMAFNRYWCIASPLTYSRVFSKQLTAVYIALTWVFSCLVCVPFYLDQFSYVYEPDILSFVHDTSKPGYDITYWAMYLTEGGLFVVLCAGFYISLLVKVRNVRRKVMQSWNTVPCRGGRSAPVVSKMELRLSVQFFINCLLYTVAWLLHYFCLSWIGSLTEPYADALQSRHQLVKTVFNLVWIINYSTNVYVYMMFNVTLRKRMMLQLLRINEIKTWCISSDK